METGLIKSIYKYVYINILLTQNNTIFIFFLPYNEIVR